MTSFSYHLEMDDCELDTFEAAMKLLQETHALKMSELDVPARAPYERHLSNIEAMKSRIYNDMRLRSINNFWRRKRRMADESIVLEPSPGQKSGEGSGFN
jgi:hypothetical protein